MRDGDAADTGRVSPLDDAILMSVITRVEPEGGVHRVATDAPARRIRLDVLLRAIPTLAFDDASAEVDGTIVAQAEYSRRKLLDRSTRASCDAGDDESG